MGLFRKSADGPSAVSGSSRRRDDETAFLGAQISVKGKVSGAGNLIVMGRLEGQFELDGELIVAPPAVVTGEIKAGSVTISGTLTGTVAARERIHLEKGAVVTGSLAGARLTVADGAVFNGEVAMTPAETAAQGRSAKRG
ncbi:MAG: polymer-forming cytoskeletal protein [Desulfobacterales bacterium]|jgi:cytoskeletal protein CcmA (bactofilin family)|nr:polymer-forming cytoskeletal protein [Desulfobacterales bacterium]